MELEIYQNRSENGNPQLNTIRKILHELGFKFSIEARENRPQAT